jgi:hypothetical protein
MDKRLTRNYTDPDSRRWWEAAEKAGANPPKIVVPSPNNDLKAEAQLKVDLNKCDPEVRGRERSKYTTDTSEHRAFAICERKTNDCAGAAATRSLAISWTETCCDVL